MKETIRGILMVFVFYGLIMFLWFLYMLMYGINIVTELFVRE